MISSIVVSLFGAVIYRVVFIQTRKEISKKRSTSQRPRRLREHHRDVFKALLDFKECTHHIKLV